MMFRVQGTYKDNIDEIAELSDPFEVQELLTVNIFVTQLQHMIDAYTIIKKLKQI